MRPVWPYVSFVVRSNPAFLGMRHASLSDITDRLGETRNEVLRVEPKSTLSMPMHVGPRYATDQIAQLVQNFMK